MPPGAEFAWSAFWRLHGDRAYTVVGRAKAAGLGGVTIIEPVPLRIPFSAIDRYALRYRITGTFFDLLLELVTALDQEFLAVESERARERATR